ncbi:flagellar basal body P-ring formation chaperone FlgA [Oceanibacterium hippocampi]|uniref:Flagellar basal body P-ring biosynthesis protein FlgA n=1 Tax=Oceanibacterium hippocampi TaxID=745714 RepID=A0A1Y5U237_9PROT|nr:flagellar basal body P-ring formation chaperone FlgA [Oceanibacterium hippocampi]SLN77133.1 flagellar basal body P-ring biosynthesis protein FlgA [Oceanibacterium hippocampi]
MRIATFVLALGLALGVFTAEATAETVVTLRHDAVVDGNQIRVGDVFDGAGAAEKLILSGAPRPGETVVFRPSSLVSYLHRNNLAWRPSPDLRRVVVRRAGNLVSSEAIVDEIRYAIEQQGHDGSFDIQLSLRNFSLYVASDEMPTVAVRDLVYDAHRGQFQALIVAPATGEGGQRLRVSGRVFKSVEVPVLARQLSPGEVIAADDVRLVAVRESTVRRNTVLESDTLVGMAVKRPIRAGQPVRVGDLTTPKLVTKGELVSIRLRSGSLSLTASGIAQESGAAGDIIRVVNQQSRKTIQATVEGPRIVTVDLQRRVLADAR